MGPLATSGRAAISAQASATILVAVILGAAAAAYVVSSAYSHSPTKSVTSSKSSTTSQLTTSNSLSSPSSTFSSSNSSSTTTAQSVSNNSSSTIQSLSSSVQYPLVWARGSPSLCNSGAGASLCINALLGVSGLHTAGSPCPCYDVRIVLLVQDAVTGQNITDLQGDFVSNGCYVYSVETGFTQCYVYTDDYLPPFNPPAGHTYKVTVLVTREGDFPCESKLHCASQLLAPPTPPIVWSNPCAITVGIVVTTTWTTTTVAPGPPMSTTTITMTTTSTIFSLSSCTYSVPSVTSTTTVTTTK